MVRDEWLASGLAPGTVQLTIYNGRTTQQRGNQQSRVPIIRSAQRVTAWRASEKQVCRESASITAGA